MITPKIDPVLILDEKGTLKASADASGAKKSELTFKHRTRHLVIVLSLLCLTCIISNSLALNFTVICMFKDDDGSWNQSYIEEKGHPPLMYSELEQSWLFAAIAIGTLFGTIPMTLFTSTFGMKILFTLYGAISALATLIFPTIVPLGFYFVFFLRFLQGAAVATSFPAMGSIVAEWATLRKSGTFVAIVSAHLQLAQIFTMPVAGALCESSLSWPALYYLQGGITVICFVIFWLFYEDTPTVHRNVSEKELTTLQKNKIVRVLEENEKDRVPYKAIMCDRAVMGILTSSFGATVAFQFFFQYGPVYLNQVQGFDVRDTGFAAALPFILSMIFKFMVGPCSDTVPYVSDKMRVILFASISQYSMAICFFALAFLPPSQQVLSQIFFTAAIVFSGLNAVGVTKSSQLISGRYVHFLMSLNMFIFSIVVLLIPFSVAVFAPNGSPDEWARLFIGTGILVIVVTTIFNLTAEVTVRPWADQPQQVQPVPEVFELNAKDLKDPEKVGQVLQAKRLSIQSNSSQLRQFQAGQPKRTSIYSVD
ncbi:unnamed protein product [Bursaphelenchus okinawaensis]|uniref:Major facilitator superfamily (MFS) profile domain-containing protein n=1 Tax=Bursaphelenchus okinawaensis TaxID=465554 RepID=A0A811JUK7_9BILA|nr:unnamed protein product [Bursaphelenchus okinawaensis]CAG9083954.1 unnamed protein product [Bursaphelenchus okinawaensis]